MASIKGMFTYNLTVAVCSSISNVSPMYHTCFMNLDESYPFQTWQISLGSQQRGAAPNQICNTLRPASLSHHSDYGDFRLGKHVAITLIFESAAPHTASSNLNSDSNGGIDKLEEFDEFDEFQVNPSIFNLSALEKVFKLATVWWQLTMPGIRLRGSLRTTQFVAPKELHSWHMKITQPSFLSLLMLAEISGLVSTTNNNFREREREILCVYIYIYIRNITYVRTKQILGVKIAHMLFPLKLTLTLHSLRIPGLTMCQAECFASSLAFLGWPSTKPCCKGPSSI